MADYNARLAQDNSYSLAQLGAMYPRRVQAAPSVTPWNPVATNPNLALIDPKTGLPYSISPPASVSTRPTAANTLAGMAPVTVPQAPQLPSINLTPTRADVGNAIDLSNLVNENTLSYYEKAHPGYTATNDQLHRNIADAAAGRLAPEDEANIIRQGVEMGAAMGVPGSPSAISGTLARYYGGIQALKDKAEQLAASEYARTPKPTDATQFLTKPEQQVQLIIEQARLQGAVLHDATEAALQKNLQQMIQDGRTLDRESSLVLKQMELDGQIRHDETTKLIAAASEGGQNYRAGLSANTQANIAAGNQAEQRYAAELAAQTSRQNAALHYAPGQAAGPYLGPSPNAGGYGSGSYGAGLPSFEQVFGFQDTGAPQPTDYPNVSWDEENYAP